MSFPLISADPRVMRGAPCIRGTRLPVAMIVRMVANGTSAETLLSEYPQLSREAIREALLFAASNVDHQTILLKTSI